MTATPRRRPGSGGPAVAVLWGVLLLGALLAVYRPGFPAPFYLDTVGHLVDQTNLQVVDLSWTSLREAMRSHQGASGFDRPLARLTLALTHYEAGLDPVPYRIGNVVIHWAACLALAFLGGAVLRTPRAQAAGGLQPRHLFAVSAGAATLWGLHPVHTGAVTYVVQRMASLQGLFYFLAAASYLRARSAPRGWSWSWGGSAALCFAASLASKESAATLPLVLLAGEVLLLGSFALGRGRRRFWLLAAGGGALLFAAAGARLGALLGHLDTMYATAGIGPWQHLAGAAMAQARYALVLLVPDPRLLVLDAEIPVPTTVAGAWPGIVVWLALAAAVALVWRRRNAHPVLAFGVVWYALTQVIEVAVLPMDLYFEHRLYVPSAFWFLGLAWIVAAATRKGGLLRAAALGAGLALLGVEAGATVARNRLWADPVAFYADNVRKAPGKAGPRINLAAQLSRLGRGEEAAELLHDALRLGGKEEEAWLSLAALALRRGDREEALAWADRVLAKGARRTWRALRFQARLHVEGGDFQTAEPLVLRALGERPYDSALWELRGLTELARDDLEAAEESLLRATALTPGFRRAWANLSAVYVRTGRMHEALDAIGHAVSGDPDNQEYQARRQAIAAHLAGGLRNPVSER